MIKIVSLVLVLIALSLGLLYWLFVLRLLPLYNDANPPSIQTEHLVEHPIIQHKMHPRLLDAQEAFGYNNINGPTLIKVPQFVKHPLGKYLLYFAHHKGTYIRMAYADTLSGPWTMYDGEIMTLLNSSMVTTPQSSTNWKTVRKYMTWSEARATVKVGNEAKKAYEARINQKIKSTPPTTPHIASPEIFVDDKKQQFRLFFHGMVDGNIQMTKVALSKDGLNFLSQPKILGLPYIRVFQHHNRYYALSMPGILYKSDDGLSNFEPRRRWVFETNVRHSALYKKGNLLYIFYSKVGNSPERIVCSVMDISSENWNDWKASKSIDIASPELDWEGAKNQKCHRLEEKPGYS